MELLLRAIRNILDGIERRLEEKSAMSVSYAPDNKTDEEKAQARKNIDAASSADVDSVSKTMEDKLTNAVVDALTAAKQSGAFDGKPGEPGRPGDDYVLTEEDKTEIAQKVIESEKLVSGSEPVKVGELITVTAVDEAGNPTAWEKTEQQCTMAATDLVEISDIEYCRIKMAAIAQRRS